MSISQYDKELIERYLDGDMTSSEMLTLEGRLMADADLNDELVMQKRAIDALRKNESLKAELKDIFAEVKSERLEKSKNKKSFYWAAAAVILILSASFIFYSLSLAPDNEKLYSDYYRPASGIEVTRDNTALPLEKDLAEALSLYESQEYSKSAKKFESTLRNDKIHDKWWVYMGNCYMNLGEFKKARMVLESVSDSSSFAKQHALWYIALIDLKEGKTAQAMVNIKKIYEGGGIYQKTAKELLQELD